MDKRAPLRIDRNRPVGHATTIYCKKDHLHTLWPALLRHRSRIVLVTSESAYPIPASQSFPGQVARWFSTNTENAEVHPLPLGLGNSYCGITAKAAELSLALAGPKTKWLYVNFRTETNPEVRMPLWRHFNSKSWSAAATCESENMDSYIRQLAEHRFVLCPRGRGVDTHRMWEALYAGSIPVVENHPALDGFRDLPILFVDDFLALESAFLEKTYGQFLERSWNFDKLFLPYWKKLFERARLEVGTKIGWREFVRLRVRGSASFQSPARQ